MMKIQKRIYVFPVALIVLITLIEGFSQISSGEKFSNVTTWHNVAYASRANADANLTALDIYAPSNAKNSPVMIMIHGGGWSIGDKGNRGLIRNKIPFFSKNGFIFVSINYRLSPVVKHPAHIEDVAEAVAWVHNNIKKYGGDNQKIFVMGHSAGAHLAALVATDERRLKKHGKDLSVIKGVILLDGAGYDIPEQMKNGIFKIPILGNMYEDAFTTDEKNQRDASPLFFVSSGKTIPPFLIFTAGKRIASLNQSAKLSAALTKSGIKSELVNDPEKNHMTINNDFGLDAELVTNKARVFLESILKGK